MERKVMERKVLEGEKERKSVTQCKYRVKVR